MATGEVWRALQRDDVSHKQEIDALLRALMIQVNSLRLMSNFSKQFIRLNKINHRILIKVWNDDEIFDELLAAVPNSKTATDVHTPFVQDHHLEPEVTPQAPQTLVESSVPVSNLNQSPKIYRMKKSLMILMTY